MANFFFFLWIIRGGQSPNNNATSTTRNQVTPRTMNTLTIRPTHGAPTMDNFFLGELQTVTLVRLESKLHLKR